MTRCCTAAGRETDNNPRTEAEGREVAPGSAHKKKDVKNEDRTDYVYENK